MLPAHSALKQVDIPSQAQWMWFGRLRGGLQVNWSDEPATCVPGADDLAWDDVQCASCGSRLGRCWEALYLCPAI